MDDQAFQSLVDRFYQDLYRFALSLARREAEACDLVQQTFFIWAKKGDQLRDGAKAKQWLFTTLYREFTALRRHELRLVSSAMEDGEHEELSTAPSGADSLDAGLVMEALGQVEEIYRAPLSLFYLEDLSYKEIAGALEIPPGTVMSRLSRGKQQLRRLLRDVSSDGKITPFQPETIRHQSHE